ncbi:UNVERIFIED_CONTAM: Phosphoribosylaminoimidazole-succinocarboxamide synthase, chloroplastic [Sesamum indicum]
MALSQCPNPPKNLKARPKPFLPTNSPSYRTIIPQTLTPKKFPSMVISASSSPSTASGQPSHPLDVQTNTERKKELMNAIKASLSNCLSETHLHLTVPGLQSKTRGKVLNETSLWWFSKTQHIISNAVVSSPDRNVTIAKKCSVFPVEFVGMVKNQKLPANILTPTTKAADHDVPVTPEEIIQRGLMTQADYDEASKAALSLFEYGQRIALEHGLILVDTKYEFGKGSDGTVLLIDEVHTPDSSRYWVAHSYEERFQKGLEPENIDKEFLRLWFKDHCNPYEDEVLPAAPDELVSELAWRYILLYETITKSKLEIPLTKEPIHERISRNVSQSLSSLT